MDRGLAGITLQQMHETRCLTNEALLAWYSLYGHYWRRLRPQESEVDMIRVGALWMEMSARGATPEFPEQYCSKLSFPSINPHGAPGRPSMVFVAGVLLSIAIVAATVFYLMGRSQLGMASIQLALVGLILAYIDYRLKGGVANPDRMGHGTWLYKREGRPLLEWSATHRSEVAGDLVPAAREAGDLELRRTSTPSWFFGMGSPAASLLIAVVAFFLPSPPWLPVVGVVVGVHAARRERQLARDLGVLGIVVNGFFVLLVLGSP